MPLGASPPQSDYDYPDCGVLSRITSCHCSVLLCLRVISWNPSTAGSVTGSQGQVPLVNGYPRWWRSPPHEINEKRGWDGGNSSMAIPWVRIDLRSCSWQQSILVMWFFISQLKRRLHTKWFLDIGMLISTCFQTSHFLDEAYCILEKDLQGIW